MDATRLAEILELHEGENAGGSRWCPACIKAWPCETFELATLAVEAERLRAFAKLFPEKWAAFNEGWEIAVAALEKAAGGTS